MVGGAVTTGTVVATVVTGAGAAEVGAGVGATVGADVVGAGVVGAAVVGASVVATVVATVIVGGGVTGGIVAGVATVLEAGRSVTGLAGTVALADADVVGATVPADSASLVEGVDDCVEESLFGEGVLDDDGGVLIAWLLRTVFCAPITGTALVGFGLLEEPGVSGEADVGRCAAVVVGRAKVTSGAAGEGTLTVDGGAVDSMRRPVSVDDASSTGSAKSTTARLSNETSPLVGASGPGAASALCGSNVSADRAGITSGTGWFGATGGEETVLSAPLTRAS